MMKIKYCFRSNLTLFCGKYHWLWIQAITSHLQCEISEITKKRKCCATSGLQWGFIMVYLWTVFCYCDAYSMWSLFNILWCQYEQLRTEMYGIFVPNLVRMVAGYVYKVCTDVHLCNPAQLYWVIKTKYAYMSVSSATMKRTNWCLWTKRPHWPSVVGRCYLVTELFFITTNAFNKGM